APSTGADRLVADPKTGILLINGMDFDLFSWKGAWKNTFQPLDPKGNFYGLCGAEALANGDLALLVRLESAQEQWGKDNFEMRSKPGVRRVVLDDQGHVLSKNEWADPLQPHSSYWSLEGGLCAVHDDGTFTLSQDVKGGPSKAVSLFAQATSSPDHWAAHL